MLHEQNQTYDDRSNDHTPLYNSRIINTYIEYIKKYHPDVDTDLILKSADMSINAIEDPGQWFSQHQADRFHEIVVAETGNKNIAREAGRYTASAKRIGAPKQYALGLMNLSSVYLMVGKLSSHLTRGATAKVKKLGPSRVEIVNTPTPGTNEKPYQCQNRIGSIESAAKLFTNKFARVEHPECLHKGDSHCRYNVSWEWSASLTWNRVRNYFFILGAPVCLALFFVLPLRQWGFISMTAGFLALLLWLLSDHVEKKELKATIETQGDVANDLLDEINIRYNNAVLVQEIGQATSMISDTDKFIDTVVNIIEHRLQFDRGIIILLPESGVPGTNIASFGYTHDQLTLIRKTWLHQSRHAVDEIFGLPMQAQKPFITNDMAESEKSLSLGNRELFNNLGTRSFLCVPLVYEKKTLGVLAVDNFTLKKRVSQSDMNLLMGVASQTAISTINTLSFNKLKESEEKYRLLADNITDVIWILDLAELKFLYASPSVEAMQGYTPAEILNLRLDEYLTPESLELAMDALTEELALEETQTADPLRSTTLEVEGCRKDGSTFWLEVTARFLRDEAGNPISILGVSRDISERKRAEKERKKLEGQLQQAHKLEAVGTLAGGIAHDFNNILSAVIGFTEMALFEAEEDSLLQENMQEVLKAGNRAKDLVKQILAFSRQADQEKKPVQIKLIVKEAIQLLRASLPTTIEIHQKLQSDAAVLADPTQIHQVLMNLCTNADHAMGNGGGRLEVGLTNVELDAEFADHNPDVTPGSYLCLAVSDTGHGMAADVQARIFEPFFTTKERGKGTGMGLAVVHGIITSHGGTITVHSEPDEGSTFKVFLPAIQKKFDESVENRDPAPTGSERVLFVDDEKALVEMGQQMLEHLGYKVTTRTSSIEALELFREQPQKFDLVITDMTMPNMTGDKLAQELIDIRSNIPVILCTGYSQQINETKAKVMGIKAFVLKPMVMNELAITIRTVLKQK